MPLGEIIEKSFKLPWKNKSLIIFGAIIALFSGSYSIVNSFESGNTISAETGESLFGRFGLLLNDLTVQIVVIALLVLGMAVATWAQAVIIQGADLMDQKKEIKPKELAKIGWVRFWRMILLNLVTPVAVGLFVAIAAVLLYLLFRALPQPAGLISGVVIGAILVLALIPVLVYLGLAWALAARYIVLEGKKVIESIKESVNLIKGRFWWTLGFALILGLVAGILGGLASLPLALAGLGSMYGLNTGRNSVAIGLAILGILFYALYLAVSGYFQVFTHTGWTLWWKALKEQPAPVKTVKAKPTKTNIKAK
jgi:hypothetical protein